MTNMVMWFDNDASMKTVNIADLKARLSFHLQRVKRGEEVLICERNGRIARIVPCHATNRSEQEKGWLRAES